MIAMLEQFLDLNILVSLLSNINEKVSLKALDVVVTILFSIDSDDCKYTLVDILCKLDFYNLFHESTLNFKKKFVSYLPQFIDSCDNDHVLELIHEPLLNFLAEYLNMDRIFEAYDVARILNKAIDKTGADFRITDNIRDVFIDESFDLMEELADDIDPDIKDAEQMKTEVDRFLANFRIPDENL